MRSVNVRGRALKALLTLMFASVALVAVAPVAPASAASPQAGDRSYELVSPGDDPNSKSVNVLPVGRPSVTGDAFAFQMFGTVDGGSSTVRNTYLAKRGADGWTSQLLTPPAAPWTPYDYRLSPNQVFQFNEDLSKVLITSQNENPLVPGEADGRVTNLYLRDNNTNTYQLITNVAPEEATNGRPDLFPLARPRVGWASKDLQHVVFDSFNGEAGRYFPDWPWDAVIDWSPATGMQPVSILPDGQGTSGDAGAGPLQIVGEPGSDYYTDYYGNDAHAISEDGSRIFFTTPPASHGSGVYGNLYVRRDNGTPAAETVQIDTPEPGAAGPPPGSWPSAHFVTATANGHRALFLSCTPWTTDSTITGTSCYQGLSRGDLYLYDESTGLTDLSPADSEGGKVLGVVGASEDLKRVYFVARGALAGDAVAEKPNLYLWDSETGLTFIAELGASGAYWHDDPDANIWTPPLGLNDARVSADGSEVAFATGAKVDPSYENTDPETWDGIKEVYVYAIGDAKPHCVTCVGEPAAPSTLVSQRLSSTEARLPVWTDWEKRNLLPDGSALYFESSQKLLPADHNLTTDVYEYRFASNSLALISSGQGASPSHFVGASADGRDVFFTTSQGLLASDINGSADVYDARRGGGGLPERVPPLAPCTDNCPITPASSGYNGPGNQPPATPLTIAKVTTKQRTAFARSGKLTIKVGAPAAGPIVARAFGQPPGSAWRKVATGKADAASEGTNRLTLRLSKGARRVLAKKGRLVVRIEVNSAGQYQTTQFRLQHKSPHKKAESKSPKHRSASKSKTVSRSNA